MDESDRTASLMSPARLAQMKPKAATTPAAWLTQMAADAGHMHVKRIGEIAAALHDHATTPGLAALVPRLQELAQELPTLDFSLLEPQGWWARTSGKSKTAGAEFAARFEPIDEAAGDLAKAAGALLGQQADAAATERALVELEVEYRAVEKIIDQGARWLQDMRSQIKVRQAAATDQQAQRAVLEDSVRCDILVDRLKLLRGLCNAAAPVPDQARASAQARATVVQSLQQPLARELKDWRGRLAAVAAGVVEGKNPIHGIQGPLDMHGDLQASVAKAIAACQQLQTQERSFATNLTALTGPQSHV